MKKTKVIQPSPTQPKRENPSQRTATSKPKNLPQKKQNSFCIGCPTFQQTETDGYCPKIGAKIDLALARKDKLCKY